MVAIKGNLASNYAQELKLKALTLKVHKRVFLVDFIIALGMHNGRFFEIYDTEAHIIANNTH